MGKEQIKIEKEGKLLADYSVNYEEISEWLKLYKSAEDEKQKKHLQNIIALAAMPLVKKIA